MQNNFNKFDEIEHEPLRVYNRLVLTHNLLEDGGEYAAKEYLDMFTTSDRVKILKLNNFLKKNGVDKTISVVTKDLELEDPHYEHPTD